MSDDALPGPSNVKREEKPDIDEKLDLFSDKFDPLLFLYSDRAKIPKPDAKVFDNLSMWYSHDNRRGDTEKKGRKNEKTELPARRWLPHQMPVESKRPTRIRKNVFTRMETIQGPLALLRKYTEEKIRIKIITRNEKGIRGYCCAYLLAFDKHFNLVLEEVDEVWKRSIRVKTNPIFTDASNDQFTLRYIKNRVKIPTIDTKKVSKNTEECRRHVDQMLMRGEHVVVICVAPSDQSF